MSVNRNRPHLFVLPEDDANSQIATGFQLGVDWDRQRQMQVLEVAGGGSSVLDLFRSVHVPEMERYPNRFMVLLIDFDRKAGRLQEAKGVVPDRLTDRVFILGSWDEPENLKPELGSYETIGKGMARDCRDGTNATWGHALLQHNAGEVVRMRELVRPILFEGT